MAATSYAESSRGASKGGLGPADALHRRAVVAPDLVVPDRFHGELGLLERREPPLVGRLVDQRRVMLVTEDLDHERAVFVAEVDAADPGLATEVHLTPERADAEALGQRGEPRLEVARR